MPFKLPDLPWSGSALAPHISADTIDCHYGQHHQGYVDTLNRLTEGRPEAGMTLEALMDSSTGQVFNSAAQVWNHTFHWHSMKPGGGGRPAGALADAIRRQFGGLSGFNQAFAEAANSQFGSGWAWLAQAADGSLHIVTTDNADCPQRRGATPLVTLDLWEHAYYLDYRSARASYVEAFLDHLLNWDFVAGNLLAKRGMPARAITPAPRCGQ